MSTEFKCSKVLDHVGRDGTLVGTLAKTLGVNYGTAWRQLLKAEGLGLVERTATDLGDVWTLTEAGREHRFEAKAPRCRGKDCNGTAKLDGPWVLMCEACGHRWQGNGHELEAARRVEGAGEQLGLAGVA